MDLVASFLYTVGFYTFVISALLFLLGFWLLMRIWFGEESEAKKIARRNKEILAMTYAPKEACDIRKSASKFSGFDSPATVMNRLKEMIRKIHRGERVRMRTAEMAYMIKHTGGNFLKSRDGTYYIVGKKSIESFLAHVDTLNDTIAFVKELKDLDVILAPKLSTEGKINVNATELFHKARNNQLHPNQGQDFFEVVNQLQPKVLIKTESSPMECSSVL